jgi:hypothetical protein
MRACAEMLALGEGDVIVGCPSEVKGAGILELRFTRLPWETTAPRGLPHGYAYHLVRCPWLRRGQNGLQDPPIAKSPRRRSALGRAHARSARSNSFLPVCPVFGFMYGPTQKWISFQPALTTSGT